MSVEPSDKGQGPRLIYDTGGGNARNILLEQGLKHHEAGELGQAAVLYARILDLLPDDSEALHLAGVVLHQRGDHAGAITQIVRAIAANPGVALYHNNLGSAYQALKQYDMAARCVERGLALNPDLVDGHYNLGVILNASGDLDQAENSFRRALEMRPGFAQAHFNLGILLRRTGRHIEAAAFFREAARLDPRNVTARFLGAASGGQQIAQAPPEYVSGIFDADADQFEQRLVSELHYETPKRLLSMCGERWMQAAMQSPIDLLDLGCGTGLAGACFAPYARSLVGVDLSAAMLEHAKRRRLYQRLVHAGLLDMMQREPGASYDLVVAADVLIYFGRLDEVFAQAWHLLRPGGLLAFSTEALDVLEPLVPPPQSIELYRLHQAGRFAHAAVYLRALAQDYGFTIFDMQCAQTRLEAGQPVMAWHVVLQVKP